MSVATYLLALQSFIFEKMASHGDLFLSIIVIFFLLFILVFERKSNFNKGILVKPTAENEQAIAVKYTNITQFD